MNNEKILWKDLYERVKKCKETSDFTKFSDIDNCVADIDLLHKYTPNDAKYSSLKDAIDFTKTRVLIYKKIKKREVNNEESQLTEGDYLKEVYSFRMNRNFENDYWNLYEVSSKSTPKEEPRNSEGFSFGLVFVILIVFFSIYMINFFLSGRFERKMLISKLNFLEFDTYSSILQKSVNLEEIYDKKQDRKKGILEELTLDEKIIVERIIKMKDKIDVAYSLKKIIDTLESKDRDENQKKLNDLLNKINSYIKR